MHDKTYAWGMRKGTVCQRWVTSENPPSIRQVMGDESEMEEDSEGDTSEGIELSEALPAPQALGGGALGGWCFGMGWWDREGNGGNIDSDVNFSPIELSPFGGLGLVSMLMTRSSEMRVAV
jgi:hypothetical protein